MKGIILFVKEALSSVDGASSKRLITFMIVVVLLISLVVAQLFNKVPPEWMYTALVNLSMFGLGAVASEIAGKFAKSKTDEKLPD